jgi:hypothetical protein
MSDRRGRRDHRAQVPAAQVVGLCECLFEFSGAVASHLLAGDGVEVWRVPLVYEIVIVSWALSEGAHLKGLAEYCGTSVQIIEQRYGRYIRKGTSSGL